MKVSSNLAISLDGKIATAKRGFLPLGTPLDRKHMLVLRRKCDVVLMGGQTLRSFRAPCTAGVGYARPMNAILSRNLRSFSPSWRFFTEANLTRILFVTEKPTARERARFSHLAEIIVLRSPSRTSLARQILRELKRRKVSRVLVEGGGGVMWHFACDNLISEYHVTLTPKILGGKDAPTLVDGDGFLPSQVLNLKLLKCRRVKDELYLCYGRRVNRGLPKVKA